MKYKIDSQVSFVLSLRIACREAIPNLFSQVLVYPGFDSNNADPKDYVSGDFFSAPESLFAIVLSVIESKVKREREILSFLLGVVLNIARYSLLYSSLASHTAHHQFS